MDASEIEKLAKLARLEINQETLERTAGSITEVLALVDQLQEADTGDTRPMAHPLDAVQVLRSDEVSERNQREKYQAIAPAVEDGLFLVPKVIE
ncbi:MAG: Asp-tRNA(Asn)/Glu-tRNA(Gln) amidotransferase subunit GatC [Agarilytica sp.]